MAKRAQGFRGLHKSSQTQFPQTPTWYCIASHSSFLQTQGSIFQHIVFTVHKTDNRVHKLPFAFDIIIHTRKPSAVFSFSFCSKLRSFSYFPNMLSSPDSSSVCSLLQPLSCLSEQHLLSSRKALECLKGCHTTKQAPWVQYLPQNGKCMMAAHDGATALLAHEG